MAETGTSASDSGSTSGASTGAVTGGSTGAMPVVSTYHAVIAECVALADPDPVVCAENTDPGYVQVDGDEPDLGGAVAGFFSFEVDDAAAGLAIQSVSLRMRAHPQDPGSQMGDVWAVEPFTLASLGTAAPAQQGAAPLAASPGQVDGTLAVEWMLPTSAVTPGQPLFLGVFSDEADGVDYEDELSTAPPELVVTAQ